MLKAISEELDQTLRTMASDLVLFCLLMSLKYDALLKWFDVGHLSIFSNYMYQTIKSWSEWENLYIWINMCHYDIKQRS